VVYKKKGKMKRLLRDQKKIFPSLEFGAKKATDM
jgi:hypothetical protein